MASYNFFSVYIMSKRQIYNSISMTKQIDINGNNETSSRHLYCVYTIFPAAPAVLFAQNVVCHGILVIYFSVFKIYYVLLSVLTLYYDIHNKPW